MLDFPWINSICHIRLPGSVLSGVEVPWVPEVFPACGGNFQCLPKAEAARAESRAFRAGHCKDLTETGNRARKVSGTRGRVEALPHLTLTHVASLMWQKIEDKNIRPKLCENFWTLHWQHQ